MRVGRWLYDRLQMEVVIDFLRTHKVPSAVAGKKGWMYVFGNAALVVFLLQVLTGIGLIAFYVPAAGYAYDSVVYITEEVPLGWFLRAMHFFGASAMVATVAVHMARVFLTGSYKFPRELNWMTGVLLGTLTLGMAFTGQLLRWDEGGLWGVVVASEFVARVPFIGEWLAQLVLGGDTVGGPTLSRFYALHVFVLPTLIFLTVGLHVFLVVRHGISEPPKTGEPVDPATYRARYEELEKNGRPYFPYVVWKEAVFGGLVFAAIVVLALVFGPKEPGHAPDPTILHTDPRPDWFVVWYYALLFVKRRDFETLVMVYLPILVFVVLLVLPLVANKGERSLRRRPWAAAVVLLVGVLLGWLIMLGSNAPWTPEGATEPLGTAELGAASPEVLRGAEAFVERGCQQCHTVLGRGGEYGPDLTRVTVRLSPEEVAVRTIDGIGDMPAYRGVIPREELDQIIGFLEELPLVDARR